MWNISENKRKRTKKYSANSLKHDALIHKRNRQTHFEMSFDYSKSGIKRVEISFEGAIMYLCYCKKCHAW